MSIDIKYKINEEGYNCVVCGNKKCSDYQIPSGHCWQYSEPTPRPGGEKTCKGYINPDEENLEKKLEKKENA